MKMLWGKNEEYYIKNIKTLYKAGDIVKVNSLKWFEDNCLKDPNNGFFYLGNEFHVFYRRQFIYCEKAITIKELVNDSYYVIEETGKRVYWEDWMFKDMTKENIIEILRGDWNGSI